jgi:hypothetical protein
MHEVSRVAAQSAVASMCFGFCSNCLKVLKNIPGRNEAGKLYFKYRLQNSNGYTAVACRAVANAIVWRLDKLIVLILRPMTQEHIKDMRDRLLVLRRFL